MTRVAAPLRRKKATRRLDLTDLGKLLRDRRIWCALGVVTVPPGETLHYRIDAEDGTPDVLVDVVTVPDGLDLTCRLGVCAGGGGGGVWRIPPAGAEVAVLVAAGEISFQPIIVAVVGADAGALPEGLGVDNVVIAATPGRKVQIHDGTGSARPLAFKDELEALTDKHNTHVHVLTLSAASGSGGTGTAAATADPAPAPTGTAVLEAK